MNLDLLYPAQLTWLNRSARACLLTCWSNPEKVLDQLRSVVGRPLVDQGLAAASTLYGNGMGTFLRNLAYNPQIRTILVVGQDRSGILPGLRSFFAGEADVVNQYGLQLQKMEGCDVLLDGGIVRETVGHRRVHALGDIPSREKITWAAHEDLRNLFLGLNEAARAPAEDLQRVQLDPASIPDEPRLIADMDSHQILESTAVKAYMRLVQTIYRCGEDVTLRKGKRREIRNLKVVVRDSQSFAHPDFLKAVGTDIPSLDLYWEDSFMSSAVPEGTDYTYGNRLRAHPPGPLSSVVQCLCDDPASRRAYANVFDNTLDGRPEISAPCLASVFFRADPEQRKLNMTATFRTHNALLAWPRNGYALARLLNEVVGRVSKSPVNPHVFETGSITIFSQSISLDMDTQEAYQRAQKIASFMDAETQPAEDPSLPGHFVVRTPLVPGKEIHVEYVYQGIVIRRWKERNAVILRNRIASSGLPISTSHSLYLGGVLDRAERAMKENLFYEQR